MLGDSYPLGDVGSLQRLARDLVPRFEAAFLAAEPDLREWMPAAAQEQEDAATFIESCARAFDAALDPSGAAVAAAALVQLAGRLDGALAAAATLHEQVLFLDDFVTFLELGKDAGGDSAGTTAAPSSSGSLGTIRVDRVGFSYPATDRPVLRDVSLELPAGKVIALVGENGAGKTTLAKIISGLYRPTAGSVAADGQKSLGDIDSPASRSRIAVLFQDFAKYQLSAWDNIQVGDTGRGADRAAMVDAARRARAEEFPLKLPDGFDSMLSRQFRGLDLSIGQWQRIALARAFYRDAELVILDESTAAIDARSEHELFDDIRSLCHDRSVLLVSHRFSTVRAADRIYVLHDGQISEEGTHDELMALGGTYHELFTLQASSYVDQSTERAAEYAVARATLS